MIKLDLPAKPEQLTDEFVVERTQAFKDGTNKSPWNINWLREAVEGMAFGKCCYSEVRLNEEGKYMEVEHFLPKSIYKDKVMEWGNLLPACKPCNTAKGGHDTGKYPIVNPFVDDPKEYFYIDNKYCYQAKDDSEKGKLTLTVLGLNHIKQFVMPRYRVASKLVDRIHYLKDNLIDSLPNNYRKDNFNTNDIEKINKHIHRLKNLMKNGNRKEEYAALTSTVILSDGYYEMIEAFLKIEGLWDDELQRL